MKTTRRDNELGNECSKELKTLERAYSTEHSGAAWILMRSVHFGVREAYTRAAWSERYHQSLVVQRAHIERAIFEALIIT